MVHSRIMDSTSNDPTQKKLLSVEAVIKALRVTPAEAVPGVLDAMVMALGTSPSTLLSSLLHSFSEMLWSDEAVGIETFSETDTNFLGSFLIGLLHLLKESEDGDSQLGTFVWKVCFPLLQHVSSQAFTLHGLVAQVLAEMFTAKSAWGYANVALVPYLRKSLELDIHNRGLNVMAYPQHNGLHRKTLLDAGKFHSSDICGGDPFNNPPLKLDLVCHIVALLLMAAFDAVNCNQYVNAVAESEKSAAEDFCKVVVSDFLAPALTMFTQSNDDVLRHYAMKILLPPLLKVMCESRFWSALPGGTVALFSRESITREIWLACKALLSIGSAERQEAFVALSLFVDFLLPCLNIHPCDAGEDPFCKFLICLEPDFWLALKEGLVDPEALTRKRALFLLKKALERLPGSEFGCQNNARFQGHQKVNTDNVSTCYLSKRERWAQKEALTLGLSALRNVPEDSSTKWQCWDAFILLYEILEEYGTHLVEAAWTRQMPALILTLKTRKTELSNVRWSLHGHDVSIWWITVLWQRGFEHKNPQVRRLIMQSFLELGWDDPSSLANNIPEDFILGSFLLSLNDEAHHKDFGEKGAYSSNTARSAQRFFQLYSSPMCFRDRATFLEHMIKVLRIKSFCRAGLMTLAMCIQAVAETGCCIQLSSENAHEGLLHEVLLDAFRVLVEDCKHHFNPQFRLKVCSHVLKAASSLVALPMLTFSKFIYFVSAFPNDVLGYGGPLHSDLLSWLKSQSCLGGSSSFNVEDWMRDGLYTFAEGYIRPQIPHLVAALSDEDIAAWNDEAEEWARITTMGILNAQDLSQLLLLVQEHGLHMYERPYKSAYMPEKVLLLLCSLLKECRIQSCKNKCPLENVSIRSKSRVEGLHLSTLSEHLNCTVHLLMDDVLSYAKNAVTVFWDYGPPSDTTLPAWVTGKLGGPSQRRLPVVTSASVLQALVAVRVVADCVVWCCEFGDGKISSSAVEFIWDFSWHVVITLPAQSEIVAEIQLASYEALAFVCNALAASIKPEVLACAKYIIGFESTSSERILDSFLFNLLQSVDTLLKGSCLARSRRAVLLQQKWYCIESLLSISSRCISNTLMPLSEISALSCSNLVAIFHDAIDSIEIAGEGAVIQILRSIRWLMKWNVLSYLDAMEDSQSGNRAQAMWRLVRSCWSTMYDCKKRRVAPLAAFLSAIIHPNIFGDLSLHINGENEGPLKWLIVRLIEHGSQSPRTMRLTALHVTGLWLRFPMVCEFYITEMKILSLHGAEIIDEELDTELVENKAAGREYLTLMQSCDPELLNEFTNSEMYARVTVAIFLDKLARMVKQNQISGDSQVSTDTAQALKVGRMLLLELLDSMDNDAVLSRELYKKKSVIHRRKVRALQMICILSSFVDTEILEPVNNLLEKFLQRSNLPSVRQYIEIFAALLYLKFPFLVHDRLLPALLDYNMKTQALSSYVFIATNVLLHANPDSVQKQLVQDLLPAIIPFLTTHHHSLRSFSQILIYEVLKRILRIAPPYVEEKLDMVLPLEKKCIYSIMTYLEENTDCKRIRISVEKYLDAFNPQEYATPRGIFSIRNNEYDSSKATDDASFECVPRALMDHISQFLNDAREDLRDCMAADSLTLKNEEISNQTCAYQKSKCHLIQNNVCIEEALLDSNHSAFGQQHFQRKIGSLRLTENSCISEIKKQALKTEKNCETLSSILSGIEREEDLLHVNIESRVKELAKMRGNRQDIILVASLLDRIPNLAGLARTCEVFKVASLIVADSSVLQDKQFQLISVTAEMWVPIKEVPVANLLQYLKEKKKENYCVIGLEQTANSITLDKFVFPNKTVLVLGKEKEGIPVNIIQALNACIEIPQFGVIRSLNVHVSGAIAVWEYTRQQLGRLKL